MEEEYKELIQIHICPICKKKTELYAVNNINQECPCIECQLKERQNDNKELSIN